MNVVLHDRDPKSKPVLVAVDLGAESCRVSLLRWIDGPPEIRLVHRFANSATNRGNGLHWGIAAICEGVEEGLRTCAQLAPDGIDAIGVDGWAVDYVRLGPGGQPVADPFCYRDERNVAALTQVHSRIAPERLYQLTGAQIITLNTLYQLSADRHEDQNLPWAKLAGVFAAPPGREARFRIHQRDPYSITECARSFMVRRNLRSCGA